MEQLGGTWDSDKMVGGSSNFAGLGFGSGVADLDQNQVRRVRSFWRCVERYPAGASLECRDEKPRDIVVVSGWIAETRILPDGRRQIFSFLLPGDVAVVGLNSNMGCRGLVALTRIEIADTAGLATGEQAEMVSLSLRDTVRRREERLFDHIVRIGRLTAKERVLNLLLEFHERLGAVGLVKDGTFRIPLTQENFADALGLSVVHINRTLKLLRREGMATVARGFVTLQQPDKLSTIACYQPDIGHRMPEPCY
jgi:CRP-like cAMP-binding protein